MSVVNVPLVKCSAANAFTFTSNVAADDTVVIGDKTYTFKAAPSAAYEVDVGTDLTTSIANLVAAINLSGTAGTEYGASHAEAHPAVVASGADGTTFDLAARIAGAQSNGIYLAATSPGANTIAVTGGGVTLSAVTSATAGSGLLASWVTSFKTGICDPKARTITAINELV